MTLVAKQGSIRQQETIGLKKLCAKRVLAWLFAPRGLVNGKSLLGSELQKRDGDGILKNESRLGRGTSGRESNVGRIALSNSRLSRESPAAADQILEETAYEKKPHEKPRMRNRMNGAVICLSVVIGLVVGGLVWWIKRSFLAALMVPVVVVGFVALALPPAVAPVGPPPDAVESEQVTSEDSGRLADDSKACGISSD